MISVIVPVYNSEKYLRKCVSSILTNTYKNLQVILVDDGSTDSSGKICDEYAKNDKRVQVLHKRNGGQNSARKAGILVAKGEYISFVDSDDWIDSNYYEVLYSESNDADLVSSAIMYEQDNDESFSIADGLSVAFYNDIDFVLRNFFLNHVGIGAGLNNTMVARLWRTNLVMKIVDKIDIGVRLGEDWYYTLLFLLNAKSVNVLDYCGYHYTWNPNSVMHSLSDSYLSEQNKLYLAFKNTLNGFYLEKEMLQDFQIRFMNDLITNTPIKYGFYFKTDVNFEFNNILKNKKICIFGAGKIGRRYFNQLLESRFIKVVLWCDNRPDAYKPLYSVSSPDNIKKFDIDYILVAVAKKEMFEQIEKQLLAMKISKKKILWSNSCVNIIKN